MTTIPLNILPFDRHAHARDYATGVMQAVVPFTTRQFWGAVWMPNVSTFITTPKIAIEYLGSLRQAAGSTPDFMHVVVGYLQESMDPEMIKRGFVTGAWKAMKGYPKGGTTNSHGGIANWYALEPQLAMMEEIGMPLLVHGELNHDWKHNREENPYIRERRFMDSIIAWIRAKFPKLKLCLEHITTKEAAAIIKHHGSETLCATITPQHLLHTLVDLFTGGPRWDMHMWPTYKDYDDLEALLGLVKSGCTWVGAGSDSAPHPYKKKIDACGCPGGFFSTGVIELYAEAFARIGALEHLENFLGVNTLQLYGLTPRVGRMVLSNEEDPWTTDDVVNIPGDFISPFGYHDEPAKRRKFTWKIAA